MKEQTLTFLVTDTHFGVHQNSSTWLECQLRVFDEQIIPLAKKNSNCRLRLFHLGDLFDSRSTLNTVVLQSVRELFSHLNEVFDEVWIIGGNHDYYSPVDSDRNVCSLDFIDTDCIKLLDKGAFSEGNLFTPWFVFNDYERMRSYFEKYDIKNVFCHTDWASLDDRYKELLKDVNIVTGHIHIPHFEGNVYNIGSTYCLTFADYNSQRGFYTFEENDLSTLRFHNNKSTPRFWRMYNDDIFGPDGHIGQNDKLECYIASHNMSRTDYVERLHELVKEHNANIIIQDIHKDSIADEDNAAYSIEEYCDSRIPEHLMELYLKAKQRLKS